ncbi:MOSC domain-containing protein [Parasphingorhabdus cellanae]|uniref:MOSC domain-containing protein n=1 Tax=Parasphingorhabdus cellanae TaxID=2806553 RepID=A0ABX7T700_9SPHN|nr:MOSC domain-containing protein [Parasphingorhabdus cellanae]QTD56572.1 MOSC domain-containing protein [Parasphingorhabdus cellanae]
MIETKLDNLLIGTPKPFREDGEMSAIAKQLVDQAIVLGPLGLAGNQVADPLHHGGRDKAVHLYPVEHYEFWKDKYPDLDILNRPGAFGENFSCSGLTEDKLCLGDVFRVGEALIECSHARQPCWKLNHHFGHPDVLKTVIKTRKSGSYFRVLETGKVRAGDDMIQQDRHHPDWPLDRLFGLIIGGKHKGQGAELRALSNIPVLAETWRKRAAQLADIQPM